MRALRLWIMAVAATLVACGDGGIQSPDFTSTVKVENVTVQPASVGQGSSIPAGTTLPFRAIATLSRTVPPGTPNAVNNVIRIDEDVTASAEWTSANTAVATVESGMVRGVAANPVPVTIRASFEGFSGTTQVTVTDAVLAGVDHVRPQGVERAQNNTYTVSAGTSIPFEIYGRFSDNSVRQLSASFDVTWTSSAEAVVDNPADNNVFNTLTVGTAQIRGQVEDVQGLSPAFAAANLVVEPLNEFCESEFRAPPAVFSSEASALCIGCAVDQPVAIFDANVDTFGTMNIPLGLLLQSEVSVTVSQTPTNPLAVGRPAGFLVSRSGSLLSAELLSTVEIETVACDSDGANCEARESFGGSTTPLYLALLGLIGGEQVNLLSTGPLTEASADATGLRLTFSGGLLSAAATLNVHSTCAVAREPEEATPTP